MEMRYDIQGLRAIAVLAVIAFHYNAKLLPGGFVGVDIFMVISGYLITSILLKKKHSTTKFWVDIKQFYVSRIKRIAPAYYALIIASAITAIILLTPEDYSYYFSSQKKALFFLSNSYFANFGSYFAPGADELPLLHTWSLAIEMQFYLFIPLLIFLLSDKLLKIVLPVMVLILLVISEYQIYFLHLDHGLYFSLYARTPEFLIGSLIAVYPESSGWSRFNSTLLFHSGIILILVSAAFITENSPFPGFLSLIPCIGAALVICAGGYGYLSGILSHRIPVFLGALSYSLYLWHWPILAFLRYYTGHYYLGTIFTISFIILTFILSCLSYFLIEKPFRNKRAKPNNIYLASAVTVLLLFGLTNEGTAFNQSLVKPLPSSLTRYANYDDICHGHIVGSCLRGDVKTKPSLLVLGDSHAAMLNIFFDYLGKRNHISVRLLTASSCVTIPGFDYERLPDWAQTPCRDMISYAQQYIPSADKILLAAEWSYQLQSEKFRHALQAFLLKAGQSKTIYLMEDIPIFIQNPLRLHRFYYLHLPVIKPQVNETYISANHYIEQLASRYKHVKYISYDQTGFFRSAPFRDKKLIYMNYNHLNELGVKDYAESMSDIVMKRIFKP